MDAIFCTLAIFFFAILLFNIKRSFNRNKNLPPSPIALPIIGHLYLLNNKQQLYLSLQTLLSLYGPILLLKFGSRQVLVVSSPSAVEECFTKNDKIFANRPRSMAGDNLTYNYTAFVWAPYGPNWRILRRLSVVKIFCSKSLHKSSIVREEEVRCTLRRLFKTSAGPGMHKVELRYLLSIFVTNVITRVLVGKRFVEEDASDMNVAKQLLQRLKDKFFPSLSMNTCDFIPILRLIGYRGQEKGMMELHRIRDAFLQNLIEEIRSKREDNRMSDREEANSVTETLLSLQESEPEFYTDDVIKSVMLMMLAAGTDSSATTLEWATALLLNHPEELAKVREEIDNLAGHERLLNDSDLAKLPYLRNVVNETLRLYPPAPLLLPHFSSEPCRVGDYEVPRGTILMVNAWAMHRDPKFWNEPNKFRPERFETSLGQQEGFMYIPFGMGRRACPGANMGMQIVTLALGALIHCFEWNSFGIVEDMSVGSGISPKKAKPLEALCSPRQTMVKILSYT